MRGLISILLIGSLAIALGSTDSPEKPSDSEPAAASLSAVFPLGNVPINPDENGDFGASVQPQSQQNTAEAESSVSQGSEVSASTENLVNRRVIVQLPINVPQRQGGTVYRFQVPLEESAQERPLGREVEEEKSSADQVNNQYLPYQENEENNGKENTNDEDASQYKVKSKKVRKAKKASISDFSSIEDFQKEKYNKKQNSASQGNGSHVIEQAGTGFHGIAHPHGHYDQGNLGHGAPVVVEDHGPGYGQNHVGIEEHVPVGHGNGGHVGLHGPVGHVQPIIVDQGAGGHEIKHDDYLIQPLKSSFAKPLKPSVVHRDPLDTFDHYDKVRTEDKDNLHFHHQQKAHDHIHYGHGYDHDYAHKGFQPYNYDMNKIPECAFKNHHYYNLTFCLEDHLYPLETILWAIRHAGPYVHDLLSDVTYQSADNLVTGLTRAEEEGYTYQHYFGATHAQHTDLVKYKPPYQGYSYKTDYFKKGGYICPSDIYYGRPRRAMNTYGKWKVIVNVDNFPKAHAKILHKRSVLFSHKGHRFPQKPLTQTLRIEQCIYPNAPCSFIDSHYHSSCIQKHNFVRLVAWTIEEGLHIDTFKMPIACSCHIKQPIHFYQEHGHHSLTHGEVLPHVGHGPHSHGHDHIDHHGGYSQKVEVKPTDTKKAATTTTEVKKST